MGEEAPAGGLISQMRRRMCVIVPIGILLVLIGWRMTEKQLEHSAQAQQRSGQMNKAPDVSVSPVQVRDIVQTFDATGDVEAPLNVKIAPKITGRIEYLRVREGDRVKKGDVLVRIDTSQVEADVRQQMAAVAEAQFRLAQAQLTQNATNIGLTTQVRQQKAAVASAQADDNQVRENSVAQMAAADASVSDADGRIASADAAVGGAQAAIGSAQANLDNSRARYKRLQGLYAKGFIAAQDVDDAKAALSVQEAGLAVAQGQLKSANAQRDSALAQKRVAVQQASIVRTKSKADIEAADARLAQAQASAEYAQANTSQKAAYQQSISALRSAVEAAKAGLRSAEARRADTVLLSPLDGFVTGRFVDPGAVVTAGQAVIGVQFMRQMWVTIAVPEEVVPKLHIGQPGKITLDAFPRRSFIGSIIHINPSADPQSRQFVVRVIMDNADNLFKPGMFAHVTLETEHMPGALAVPREAVEHDSSGDYVMVVRGDGTAEQRHVTVGDSDSGFVSIEQGLRPNESVVTMSAFPLRDGQKVRMPGALGRGKRR